MARSDVVLFRVLILLGQASYEKNPYYLYICYFKRRSFGL